MPTATSSAVATKVSVERASATTSKTRLSTKLPAATMAANPSVDFRRMVATVRASCPCSTRGTTTSSGATRRSCNSRMPQLATPRRRSSHPLARSTGSTKALEERAPAALMMKRHSVLGVKPPSFTPKASIAAPMLAVVTSTCPKPIVDANFTSVLKRSTESSRPSLKRRKRIPKSPSSTSASELPTRPNPAGPMTTPARIKPRMGVMFKRWLRGTTATVAARKLRKSRPRDWSSALARRAVGVTPGSRRVPPPALSQRRPPQVGAARGAVPCLCRSSQGGGASGRSLAPQALAVGPIGAGPRRTPRPQGPGR
mmetsp:Transcript_72622/g.200387  ORF Transcript_72622/g.200387 Transcript_72622/m.200387 type:complete len:313 (+) Transcript_72622:1442-2380(+)